MEGLEGRHVLSYIILGTVATTLISRSLKSRDMDERVPVVPFADNRARARHHRRPPADEVIAQVAEAIFQPGAVPGWYQVAS